ncbi:hypothetical protein SAMN05192561_1011091 [Halopenitus malekzadehii]|uniref:Peptidase C9 domain-containing protein n=1 Tax=Halopenitus malekzadehii TaxID=1267564 RepID=A0A1H6ICA2_9EURY|nr:hypothetical protein SAMN05192561_1011091 [Halopenitus malekzadehii]
MVVDTLVPDPAYRSGPVSHRWSVYRTKRHMCWGKQ